MDRYLARQVVEDLERKKVLVGDPRQVGKTTLARKLIGSVGYLNWDVPEDRNGIWRGQFPVAPLLAVDEIHKYRDSPC